MTMTLQSERWPVLVDRNFASVFFLPSSRSPHASGSALAQRVPVRIRLKEIPEDLHLVAGMTASIPIQT